MRDLLSDGRSRPVLFGALGVFVLLALATGPLGDALEASSQIAVGRDRLARAQAAAARPSQLAPLTAQDAESLLAAFRSRLEALSNSRAAVVEQADLEADPERPALPRLRASLRGTAEDLYKLLRELETEAPTLIAEEAEIGIVRAADAESGRPTVMRASLTARGVLLPSPAPSGGAP